MKGFCVLWRRRLGGYLDGALASRQVETISRHLAGCARCQQEVEQLKRLRGLLVSVSAIPAPEPDWSQFWPSVRTRILSADGHPQSEIWWRRLFRPALAHPRLAFASAVAAMALLTLVSWQGINWWGGPRQAEAVTVHSVEAVDPGSTVMVFTSPDQGLTVIWVFGLDQTDYQDPES